VIPSQSRFCLALCLSFIFLLSALSSPSNFLRLAVLPTSYARVRLDHHILLAKTTDTASQSPILDSVFYGANVSDILTRFTHPILDILAWLAYRVNHIRFPLLRRRVVVALLSKRHATSMGTGVRIREHYQRVHPDHLRLRSTLVRSHSNVLIHIALAHIPSPVLN
jgi:hypothetical protein